LVGFDRPNGITKATLVHGQFLAKVLWHASLFLLIMPNTYAILDTLRSYTALRINSQSSPCTLFGGSMKRVTGIGGIFFKAKDAPALQAWYKRHLGIDVQEWGGTAFTWTDGDDKPVAGTTIWSIGSAQGDHFAPSTAAFMINYRVEDLHALVKTLREEGCDVLEKIDDSEYGKFAWVIDPEGNKVELWQPPAGQ
jgi:predicted enzyme related to lactoylglutathione lyase